jgi:hypothetical protein
MIKHGMALQAKLLWMSGVEEGTAAKLAEEVEIEGAAEGFVLYVSPRSMASVLRALQWHRRKTSGTVIYSRRGAPWPTFDDAPESRIARPVCACTINKADKAARIVVAWNAQTDRVSGYPMELAEDVRRWHAGGTVNRLGGQSVAHVLVNQCGWVRIGRLLVKRNKM